MINKINGIGVAKNYLQNNKNNSQPTAFTGKVQLVSKLSDSIENTKFWAIVDNIYSFSFVRGMGIFPKLERDFLELKPSATISFDKKYNNDAKKLVNELNSYAKERGHDDKLEIKYIDDEF